MKKTYAMAAIAGILLGMGQLAHAGESVLEAQESATSVGADLSAKSMTAKVCPGSSEAGYIAADLFATGSAQAHPAELFLVENGAKRMQKAFKGDNYLWIRVRSHTDSRGTDAYNDKLSAARSETMLGALRQAGVDVGKVHVVNYGERKPAYTNKTAAGRQMNRSALVEIYAMDKQQANACLRDYPNAVETWKD